MARSLSKTPLADRSITTSGASYLEELGVDQDHIMAKLPCCVIRSIQQVGPNIPSLHPLAAQLNADILQERVDQILRVVHSLELQSRLATSEHGHASVTPLNLLEPVIDAILLVPSMSDPSARMAILNSLSPTIRDTISRSTISRIDVLNTIRACQNYSDGLQQLVAAIRLIERDSTSMQNLDVVILALADADAVRYRLEGNQRP
jgi:hypothetical protein